MAGRYDKARRIAYTSDRVFRDGGMNCFNGVGGKKGGLCIVVESVDGEDAKMGGIGYGRKWWPLFSILDDFGINRRDVHVTAMVKSASKSSGKVTATELADWHSFFVEELLSFQPSAILASGTTVAQEILGKDYATTVSRGYPFGFSIESWSPDESAACKVVPCHSLAEIKHHPELDPLLRNDVRTALDVVEGVPSRHPHTNTRVLHTPSEVRQVADMLLAGGSVTLGLDCEWHGKNWMDPDRYFRTIQFAWSPTESAIVELSTEGGEPCDDATAVLSEVGRLLTDGNTAVFGQNIIADGEWLLSYGIDIRPRVMYDTMLAEYILRSDLPLSLDELAMRRTQYGRYSAPVEVWVRAHPKETALGYGFVPRDMLLSYASDDATVLWDIMKSQLPELQDRGYLDKRGRYPSLFATTMHTQQSIYELELNGMPVDKERLRQLVDVYQAKYAELLGIITSEAMSLGMPSFNPNSTADKRKLLYNYCGITPVRTSTGKDWGDYVGNMSMDSTDEVNPSTDKSTLAILSQNNPIARHLIHYNAVGQVCKTWLKYPDGSGEGGLFADLWPDGKLHSHISQLTQTGRLRTQNPNCFPGEVEVLTDMGWMRWDELYTRSDRNSIRLAQWDVDTLEITFGLPNFYIMREDEECIHVYGEQQIDILCTPDHRFTVYGRKDHSRRKTIQASQLAVSTEYVIPQAGTLVKDGTTLSRNKVTVICALQADGHLVANGGIDWRFSKKRKYDRLVSALTCENVEFRSYQQTRNGSQLFGVYVGKHAIPSWLAGRKEFGPWLLQYSSETLAAFEDEVWQWDGCESRRSMFASADQKNSDFVQAMCVFNGRRGKVRKYVSKAGSLSWQVDAANHSYTQLANLTAEDAGRRTVYCVNMPKDTVIVRYNGKVAFTNQCQNFPKRAEGVLLEVFGKDGMPPMIRSIVKPPDGWVMIEGDFSQAELFTLANLSGDEGMLKSLNTPGLDLHDKSAVDGFGFRMESKDGRPVTLDDLVRLASGPDGEDSPEYEDTLKGLTYIAQNGKRYSRSEFKNGPRIAAKAISFSVPYGIAAPSLAYNIKAQTGDKRDLAEMTAEIGRLIEKWKTVTFPTAWGALEGWQQSVYDPGYLDNPWGRRKWFHVRRGERDPAQEREAGNYPMQSLVSDTVQIACHRLLARRDEMGLHFKLQNQIHDALMLEVPEDELDRTKEVLHWAMSEIDIPTYVPGQTFRLGCDIDEYERWGEKRK